MRKVTEKTLKTYVSSLDKMKRPFIIYRKRNTSVVRISGKDKIWYKKKKKNNREGKSEIDNATVKNLCSQVARSVNRHIIKNELKIRPVIQRYPSTFTNKDKWNKMYNGQEFYYLDISHCFWRIAYNCDYIDEKLYQKTLANPKLKLYRNIALACIVAPMVAEYHDNGGVLFEISEDRSVYQTIYNNIRFISYNIMGTMDKMIKKYSIGYKTDGIMMTKQGLSKCKKFLEERGFNYRVTKCMKIDSRKYLYGEDDVKHI